nr:hypothetical protein [Eubacterium sp.]
EEEETQEAQEETSEESQTKPTADPTTEADDATSTSTQEPEEETDDATEEEETQESESESSIETASLEDALGIDGLTFKYTGYEVKKSVEEGSYFSTEPSSTDKRFVQVSFKATASKKVKLDTLSLSPRFRLTINDSVTALSQATLLESDLSTFSGTIKSGKSKNLILLFEVNKADAKSIESLYLTVTVDDVAKKVELE